jgi:hypothetical protein
MLALCPEYHLQSGATALFASIHGHLARNGLHFPEGKPLNADGFIHG